MHFNMKQFYSGIFATNIPVRYLKTAKVMLFSAILLVITTGLYAQSPVLPLGDGSAGNPYQIATLENLYWITARGTVDGLTEADRWSRNYIQTANIDASETSGWAGGGWVVIGTTSIRFSGDYDGQGHKIEGLYISRTTLAGNHAGLFGFTDNAEIANLRLEGLNVTGRENVGGIVANNGGSIINCYVSGFVRGDRNFVGGVAGNNTGTIQDCISVAAVTARFNNAGGIAGTNAGDIQNCFSAAAVTADEINAGGVAGLNTGIIFQCYSTGVITGNEIAGGLVAENQGQISNSYSSSPVEGLFGVGGLIGYNTGGVRKSYSTGSITAEEEYGGLVGFNEGNVEDSFWDTETSGQPSSEGGNGKSTGEMKSRATFINAGWDFHCETANGLDFIWGINAGHNNGYPFLSWQGFVTEGCAVWTGNNGTDWSAAANWNPGVPLDGYSIFIPGSPANYPVLNSTSNVNEVIIQPDASLTIDGSGFLEASGTMRSSGTIIIRAGGSVTSGGELINTKGKVGLVLESGPAATASLIHNTAGVEATVQRYVKGGVWQIVSPPVSGMTIGDFLLNPANDISYNTELWAHAMTHFDEAQEPSGGWAEFYDETVHGNPLKSGSSYLLRKRTDGVLTFSGTLVPSPGPLSIPRITNGWNTIGNPFSSALKVKGTTDGFLFVNGSAMEESYAALYIYDYQYPGSYRIMNNNGAELPEEKYITQEYVQSGQGFLVKAKTGGGSVNFTEAMKSHQTGATYFKKSTSGPWPTMILKTSIDTKEATTVITFNQNMTKGLDVTFDAGLFGGDPLFKLYSRLAEGDSEVNFAIQCLPDHDLEDMVVPVGFDFSQGGEVKFSTDILKLPIGMMAVLEDRALETFTDLEKDDYTVTLNENTSGTGRFYLHFKNKVIEDPADDTDEKLVIYCYDKEIFISGQVGANSFATMFDRSGRSVRKVKLDDSVMNSFRVDDIPSGVYFVRVSGKGNEKAGRVFID
jgi:hypothetical protein